MLFCNMATGGQVIGVQKTLRALGAARKQDAINIAIGLQKCGEILLRKSQELVPVLTGKLRASGKVTTTGSGFGAETVVSYGGPDIPYTIFVHENLVAYHTPPTKARFLADAVNMVKGTMVSVLQRQIKVK